MKKFIEKTKINLAILGTSIISFFNKVIGQNLDSWANPEPQPMYGISLGNSESVKLSLNKTIDIIVKIVPRLLVIIVFIIGIVSFIKIGKIGDRDEKRRRVKDVIIITILIIIFITLLIFALLLTKALFGTDENSTEINAIEVTPFSGVNRGSHRL